MDSLSLLRKYTSEGIQIDLVDERNQLVESIKDAHEFVFGKEARFPRTEITTYPNKQAKGYYSLSSLLFLLQNQEMDYSIYLKSSMSAGIPSVSFIDKKPLLKYLAGASELPSQVKLDSSTKRKRTESDVSGSQEGTTNNEAPATAKKMAKAPPLSRLFRMEIPRRLQFVGTDGYVNFTPGIDAMIIEKILEPKEKVPTFEEQKGPPIIIVPQNVTADITKYNVKKFLEGEGFERSTELLNKGVVKPKRLLIERKGPTSLKLNNKPPSYSVPTQYEILDNVYDLKADEWSRVVAVFSNGKEWQFRNYTYNNAKELFAKVPGAYVYNSKDPGYDSKSTEGWNVWRFDIATFNQNTYESYLTKFWRTVDSQIVRNMKKYLTPKTYW